MEEYELLVESMSSVASVVDAGAPPSKEEKSWDGELPWEGILDDGQPSPTI